MTASWAQTHAALRTDLLERVAAVLREDRRFVAAWLIGSFGRGEEDAFSDLDLVAVVTAPFAGVLCARPWSNAGRTTPERLALICRFGAPVVIHEHHQNAVSLGMPEGTLTLVVFDSGVELDLFLTPPTGIERPADSRLLFDRAGIPQAPPPMAETADERREALTTSVAFFWAMAVIAAKFWRRGWDWHVHAMLERLHATLANVRRLIAGDAHRYARTSPIRLEPSSAAQAAALRALCDEMEALMPAAAHLGADVPAGARALVDRWLSEPSWTA